MPKYIDTVLVLEPEAVRTLVTEDRLENFSPMRFCDAFLSGMGLALEERSGYDTTPSAVLTRYCGEDVNVDKLCGEIGAFWGTREINFVFDLRIPSDVIFEIPYEDAIRINQEALAGMPPEQIKQELLETEFTDKEDILGFIPKLEFDWLAKFAVLNSEWEIQQQNLRDVKELKGAEFTELHIVKELFGMEGK